MKDDEECLKLFICGICCTEDTQCAMKTRQSFSI